MAGTRVLTPEGYQPIERLNVGDQVLSRSDINYLDQSREVTKLMNRKVDHYYRLDTGYDTLFVTDEHPFWLQGKGWTPASKLIPGNAIATESGDILLRKVTRVEEQAQVYNFSVAESHSYFVSENGLWVHNANANCDISDRIAKTKAKPSDPLKAPRPGLLKTRI